MKYKLKVIIGSTRPSRKGPIVADWFLKIAKQHPDFEVELLDLKEIALPLMDEPNHDCANTQKSTQKNGVKPLMKQMLMFWSHQNTTMGDQRP